MDAAKFVDGYGEDVYALSLVTTKSEKSAEEVFLKTAAVCESFDERASLFDVVKAAFSESKKARVAEEAETLSTLKLSRKQEEIISELFAMPRIVRAVVHLYYENDFSEKDTAQIVGESGGYISRVLLELPETLKAELDEHYRELCLKLTPNDELKARAVASAETRERRLFEPEYETFPKHTWTKRQKTAAAIIAAVAAVFITLFFPLLRELISERVDEELDKWKNSDIVYDSYYCTSVSS